MLLFDDGLVYTNMYSTFAARSRYYVHIVDEAWKNIYKRTEHIHQVCEDRVKNIYKTMRTECPPPLYLWGGTLNVYMPELVGQAVPHNFFCPVLLPTSSPPGHTIKGEWSQQIQPTGTHVLK